MTYPTISHFIESLTGIFIPLPIQTFGLFIVLAFLTGRYFIKQEFLRLENLGLLKAVSVTSNNNIKTIIEYFVNGLISFLFGYKIIYIIQNYQSFSTNPQDILLSNNGSVLLGIFFLACNTLYIYKFQSKEELEKNKQILPSDLSWNFLFVAGVSGIIGAKLFTVFEDIDYLLANPLSALFSFSGLTFYGGLIFGTIFVILYGRKYNISTPYLADSFAPSLILAYGIGRMGCHFSGDGDWGIVSNMTNKPSFLPDWMWGYNFPHNVIQAGEYIEGCVGQYCYQLPDLVYPTSMYEALFGVLAFIFLWNIRKRIEIPGILFCIYLILNGVERFTIETFRITEKYNIVGLELTQAQVIGFIIFIVGIIGIIYLKKSKHALIKE